MLSLYKVLFLLTRLILALSLTNRISLGSNCFIFSFLNARLLSSISLFKIYRTEEKIKALEKTILESMIDQKIVLKKAEIDSVIVEENEVDLALDQQIQMLISQAGGEKKAEEALGQSIKSFRREFWYEMRDRLLSEKYQQQLINNIKVTRSDVLSFYETYKDSLPTIPLKAKVRHCLIKIKPSETAKNFSISFLKDLKTKIKQGVLLLNQKKEHLVYH